MLETWRFITLLLTALGLVMGGAHVLELVPKMHYDAPMYTAVTSTLYRFYGLVGGPIQVMAMLSTLLLSFFLRRQAVFRLTLCSALCLILSLGFWFTLVAPVNAAWSQALATAPESAPAIYEQLRPRWEYGHVAAFVLWLAGFSLLALSILRDTR